MKIHRQQFEALRPLDLRSCHTVADIIDGMSHCSFGARMLGEVSATIAHWVEAGIPPITVSYVRPASRLGHLLKTMAAQRWLGDVLTAGEHTTSVQSTHRHPVLVVGSYPETDEWLWRNRRRSTIFINQFGQARPGQVRDGYFPNVVFADPRFIIPLLSAYLDERLAGRPTTISQFLRTCARLGGEAAAVAHGACTVRAMVEDAQCTVFSTFAGAMTPAKMGLVICDMIDLGMTQFIASTGALMAHGLVEGLGRTHYKYNPQHSDAILARRKLNRITDTLEPEENFDAVEEVITHVLEADNEQLTISPVELHRRIGQYLAEHYPQHRGILKSAYQQAVPIAVPAFVDSEIGNDVFVYNARRRAASLPGICWDLENDTELLVETATRAKRLGIFSIGGGVPRNNVQNVAPLIEIYNARRTRGMKRLPPRLFRYGCRIDPAPLHFGNLGGASYSEGGSWRKMDLAGRFSEIRLDATIVLPFIVKYVMET
ncbi:MAG: deoxyhypusine synthase family protein, partial [Candidatus Andersenbacteria bacterium]|nr:deoxyhypusine synthase family protein [Candidatus Andersenbacteria bacterium]